VGEKTCGVERTGKAKGRRHQEIRRGLNGYIIATEGTEATEKSINLCKIKSKKNVKIF